MTVMTVLGKNVQTSEVLRNGSLGVNQNKLSVMMMNATLMQDVTDRWKSIIEKLIDGTRYLPID